MKYLVVILFVLIIQNVCAVCNETQIDINNASLRELDKLSGIGPVRGQAIIDYRSFEDFRSLDDLEKVYGIGEITLEKIIKQGLACVEEFEEEPEEEIDEEEILENEEILEDLEIENETKSKPRNVTLETISLKPQNIKSEDDKKDSGKGDYATYVFVFFCVLLVVLFVLKIRKNRFNKNEFEE